ncbi:MAG: aldehyde dehydrogenase family protein, partial [Candidatus Aminicenantes bacterium]|nr:aldehyde dehydrogenase family protein [Candidatus Aminicenantes bacterium]
MLLQSINPASGEKGRAVETQSWTQVEADLEISRQAFLGWRKSEFGQRRGLLLRTAQILAKEKGELARMMSLEMGKPVLQARAEIEKCAAVCVHYAENAEKMLAPETVVTGAETGYVRFDPLGTILAVMPWNFPFWQVFRFAAPALMAGNVCLLKHSSNVPGCAQAIDDIFRQAGFPDHVFVSLRIGPELVAPLIAHPLLDAVTLTGSDQAGRRVAEQAGRNLKKVVL